MYCTNCGHKNPDNNKFCIKCGNPLIKPTQEVNPQPKPTGFKVYSQNDQQISEISTVKQQPFFQSATDPNLQPQSAENKYIKDDNQSGYHNPDKQINASSQKYESHKNADSNSENIILTNQNDNDENISSPIDKEPKKSKVGTIIGILVTLIIITGGIVGYNYFIDSIPFVHSLIPSKPEIELNNFAKKIAYHTSINDIITIEEVYPTISYIDSLTVLDPQFIEIIPTNEDCGYNVNFNNATIKVGLNENGDFIITESKGLLAYPSEKVALAKETGLWEENLNDILLSERMHDTGFFDYLYSKLIVNPANILTIGKEIDSEIEINNNTNQQIMGSDYEVEYESYSRFLGPNGDYDWQYETTTYTEPGKDIAPHGKVKYEHWFGSGAGVCVKDIIIKIPQDELNRRFAQKVKWTGNEYQEYLSYGGDVITQTSIPHLASFTYDDYTYTLNPDGNITCTNPDLYGEYKKIGDGNLYKVVTRSYTEDGRIYLLIVDDNIYLIDAGSSTVITDYTYDPSTNNVTFTKMDGSDITSDDFEYILKDSRGIESLVSPLDSFEKVGTVKYN